MPLVLAKLDLWALAELGRRSPLAPGVLARLGRTALRLGLVQQVGARLYPRKGIKVWGVPLEVRRCCLAVQGK